MSRRLTFLSPLAIFSIIVAPALAADSGETVEALTACARMEERDARVDCYETLGQRVLADTALGQQTSPAFTTPGASVDPAVGVATAVAVSAEPVIETAPAEPKMEKDMGGYQFEEKAPDHPDNDIHTRVVLCQKNADKVWFFKFENGQVWKQVDRRILNFQACDFPVILSRDGFGYKLEIEGQVGKIRISRRK